MYIEFILNSVIGTIVESWIIFKEAAPYLLLGFGIAGILKVFLPDEKIVQYLGTSAGKIKSSIYAAIAGIPLPLCSCGVVPTALSLRERGATKGASLSFMIATPETGVDSISITYALLDPIMTFFRPFATFITASTAGIIENIFDKGESSIQDDKIITTNLESPSKTSCSKSDCYEDKSDCFNEIGQEPHFYSRVKEGITYAYVDLVKDIGKWLLLGIALAGAITHIIPSELLSQYLGGGVISMLIILLVGIPLYICATASTPIAASLIVSGASPGVAFVFLLAGPATNIVTLTMVTQFLGKRTAAVYLSVIVLFSMIFGLILDHIYYVLNIEVAFIVGAASEILSDEIKLVSAIILAIMIINSMNVASLVTRRR